jgi:hypothetical protein
MSAALKIFFGFSLSLIVFATSFNATVASAERHEINEDYEVLTTPLTPFNYAENKLEKIDGDNDSPVNLGECHSNHAIGLENIFSKTFVLSNFNHLNNLPFYIRFCSLIFYA